MSIMTLASARPDNPDDRFTTGYTDGELAAATGLNPVRATAITRMADDHDPMYAAGYWEGYLSASVVENIAFQNSVWAELAAPRPGAAS